MQLVLAGRPQAQATASVMGRQSRGQHQSSAPSLGGHGGGQGQQEEARIATLTAFAPLADVGIGGGDSMEDWEGACTHMLRPFRGQLQVWGKGAGVLPKG